MDRIITEDADRIIDRLGDANSRFEGKRILVTGAAGFLGVYILSYFYELNRSRRLNKNCEVTAIDSYIRGKPSWAEKLRDNHAICLLEADITSSTFTPPAADFVIHAASIASPTYYRRHPLATMDANVHGLRKLLDHSVRIRPESFLYFSSSEIYGDPGPDSIPTPETYRGYVSCTGARACYDESKRYGETLCSVFSREFEVPVKTVRPFNNYGPGLKISDRRVIPDFFRNVLNDEDIVLLSDGLPTRTFCYAADAVFGYLRALLSDKDGEAFNIGADGPEISIRDLAELVVKVSGKKLNVVTKQAEDVEYLSDNPSRRCPDITKAKKQLGFKLEYSLEQGLRRTFDWYMEHPTATDA